MSNIKEIEVFGWTQGLLPAPPDSYAGFALFCKSLPHAFPPREFLSLPSPRVPFLWHSCPC